MHNHEFVDEKVFVLGGIEVHQCREVYCSRIGISRLPLHYFESQTRYPLYIGFESRQDRLETQSFGALIFSECFSVVGFRDELYEWIYPLGIKQIKGVGKPFFGAFQ